MNDVTNLLINAFFFSLILWLRKILDNCWRNQLSLRSLHNTNTQVNNVFIENRWIRLPEEDVAGKISVCTCAAFHVRFIRISEFTCELFTFLKTGGSCL